MDIFNGDVQRVVAVLSTASLSLADAGPVRSAVAGALETGTVDEGLDQVDGVAILGLPIGREAAGKTCEHVRGQMWNANPGEYKEADVVGNPRKALGPSRFVPADELVARVYPPRGGTEERAADVAALAVTDEISHVLAHGPAQTEIVIADKILGQQSVAGLFCGDRLDGQGEQFPQRLRDGLWVRPGQVRIDGPDDALGRRTTTLRQTDESALFEFDQETGTSEVFQTSCGRPPIPRLGQCQCDLIPAPVRMLGDELADESYVFVADCAALNAARSVHAPLIYKM